MGSMLSNAIHTNDTDDSCKSLSLKALNQNTHADNAASPQGSSCDNGGQDFHTETHSAPTATHAEIQSAPITPLLFLMVENLTTRNIGPLIRTASALGCIELLIVGSKKFSTHGAHASKRRLKVVHFWYWSEAVQYVQSLRQHSRIYGLHHVPFHFDSNDSKEEEPSSIALERYAFPTMQQDSIICFVLGQERRCLQPVVRSVVDIGLHLDVGNTDFQTQMKYETVVGIVLNRFVTSANEQWTATHNGGCLFPTLSFENEKYAVDSFDPKTTYKVTTVNNEQQSNNNSNNSIEEEEDGVDVGNLFMLPE